MQNKVNLGYQLYRFGGNLPALLMGGVCLLIALITAIGAFTLDDKPICNPPYAGNGQPDASGQVIAGQIIEREERLNGCKDLAIRIQGRAASRFGVGQQAYDAAKGQPLETVLVLQNLPARYEGLSVGTKLIALYDANSEIPYAFSFPDQSQSLDIGTDRRTDYSKTRYMLYAVGGLMLIVGLTLLIIVRLYPVRRNAFNPPTTRTNATPRKPRRPAVDSITGEPLLPDEEFPPSKST